MSALVNVQSTSQWQGLLKDNNVVVADFYADWCGPCKAIAPQFERMAKENSVPKKVAFAKVNVDSQSTIARTLGVTAMPTFKVFHGGNCIETIKGANMAALNAAISKAASMGDVARKGEAFKTPGRTLGGEPLRRDAAGVSPAVDPRNWMKGLIVLVGLYLVSLLSFDGYMAAGKSVFNVNRPAVTEGILSTGNSAKNPKSSFRTLSDLGGQE